MIHLYAESRLTTHCGKIVSRETSGVLPLVEGWLDPGDTVVNETEPHDCQPCVERNKKMKVVHRLLEEGAIIGYQADYSKGYTADMVVIEIT